MKNDKEIISEYISTLLEWAYDDSRRGQKGRRAKIERLGEELVRRQLLDKERADAFYRGSY